MSELSEEFNLKTGRLILMPCNNAHLSGLFAINSDAEAMRYVSGREETLALTQSMIDRVRARWVRQGYSWWTFIERQSGEIVGAGCIQNLRHAGDEPDLNCPLEIGWRVRRSSWGQGFATEAAIAMAGFAFARLATEVLYAVCDPGNGASVAVMRKLGMWSCGVESWYTKELAAYKITDEAWRAARR